MITFHVFYYWVASLAILVVWYGVLALLRLPGAWRWPGLLMPLAAGALSFRCLGWYIANGHVTPGNWLAGTGPQTLTRFIVDIGLREETVKLLFALPCLLWLRGSRSNSSPLLISAAVGLGFAFEENRWYLAAHAEPPLLIGRLLGATLLHTMLTGLAGSGLARAFTMERRAGPALIITLLLAAGAHGLYDWAPVSRITWLNAGGTSWLSIIVLITVVAWFFTAYRQTALVKARLHAALTWLSIGVFCQLAAALVLAFSAQGSQTSAIVCLRECSIFIPVMASLVMALRSSSSDTIKPL
ncbi:MAG: PrsW family intrarane metalloprotease [Verrucomicrobiaceae bacterium]|nr:PrsW family intrarane metalloprotease [Verrucomicrobiaceae bacterium]